MSEMGAKKEIHRQALLTYKSHLMAVILMIPPLATDPMRRIYMNCQKAVIEIDRLLEQDGEIVRTDL